MPVERCHAHTARRMRADRTLTFAQALAEWFHPCLVITHVLQQGSNALGLQGTDRLARYFRLLLDQYPCSKCWKSPPSARHCALSSPMFCFI